MDVPYKYRAELINIVDGDTLDLKVDLGMKIYTHQRIRLARINSPETYGVKHDSLEYQKGIQTKQALSDLLYEQEEIIIETFKDKRGKYGRYIAEIWVKSKDNPENFINISDELASKGLAEYVNY